MHSEEIKYLIYDPYNPDEYYNSCRDFENNPFNKVRNSYFENRSCLNNVLDFLDQEVIIMPSSYFSYSQGIRHIMEDNYFYYGYGEDKYNEKWETIGDPLLEIYFEYGYHLCVLDSYITIVTNDRRCTFTDRDMGEGKIIGTIIWVKNFNEILKKFNNRKLKRISKAIVCPVTKYLIWNGEKLMLDEDFVLSMDIYYPNISFKYTIDTYMSNVCIDVYNKLVKIGLNGLVDKYIPSYKQCDGYGEKGEAEGYSTELCKCGGLRAFCYLDF